MVQLKINENEIIDNYLCSPNKLNLVSCPLRPDGNKFFIQFLEEFKAKKFFILINLQ